MKLHTKALSPHQERPVPTLTTTQIAGDKPAEDKPDTDKPAVNNSTPHTAPTPCSKRERSASPQPSPQPDPHSAAAKAWTLWARGVDGDQDPQDREGLSPESYPEGFKAEY